MNEGKRTLIEVFGVETGSQLFGAAVKVSARLNVELEDFIQDLCVAALEIRGKYGFVHINTVVNHAKNSVYGGYSYGVNKYYAEQGVCEISDSDGSFFDYIADETETGLSEEFVTSFEGLSDDDKIVLKALYQEYKGVEIAKAMGRSSAWVSKSKGRLQEAFAWAIA